MASMSGLMMGNQIAIDSSRTIRVRDSFMIDVVSGETKLVAKNPGVGVSREFPGQQAGAVEAV